jgi:hypothetical protein
MENKLVRYSRAGDVFHYRWAARRCLRMLRPKSRLKCVVIEGSKENTLAGEYVIDVAEYWDSRESGREELAYYQLKHSTKRRKIPLSLSDLKNTFEGFAERFSKLFYEKDKSHPPGSVKFSIVTNRPISDSVKKNLFAVGKRESKDGRFLRTLQNYTKLDEDPLRAFCTSIEIVDGEGDYTAQRHQLHAEMSAVVAGTIDNAQIDSVVALVQDRVLPHSNGEIVREDILKRFGVTSERDLFPAPPEFEDLKHLIKREQHGTLLDTILKASAPIIINAGGGVGKSVVARQLAESSPIGSLGIVYDCFGSGKYRNRSEPRHRYRDALVQIANEIASHGLCEPLIPRSSDLDDALLRAFLTRLRAGAAALRKANDKAILAIFIDAADNAEMAAKEFSENCFAHELLREPVPDGCRIIVLCRTERRELLGPVKAVEILELKPFSEAETLLHLRQRFPNATPADGLEFHRMTSGNPRVQANALSISRNKLSEVLASLGPAGTTVNDQIAAQLDAAISAVKEMLPGDFQNSIQAICLGLANLPPLIPITVLATVAAVDVASIKSFVADLGRPLWLSDNSVQFRDEPTETWFRQNFSASPQQIRSFVTRLKSLAAKFPYVTEALPSLLLQSENYDELISLALSDDYLPDSPIDQRNVRVHRLQFAFKAALKQKRYADAAKLALRAGEEVAGDNRQLEILTRNVDLIAPLQSEQRVQELAFRRMLRGAWDGSENVYSAALLSSVDDFKGEARGYLRSARNWLHLYFEDRKKQKNDQYNERLKDEDIAELAFAHFNLFGPKSLVDFITSWRPSEVIFRVARLFIKRLVDAANFAAIDEISRLACRSPYFMIAIADELMSVGKVPAADATGQSLDLLIHKRTRIRRPGSFWQDTKLPPAILSFVEAGAAAGLSRTKILRTLRYYLPQRASLSVSHDYQETERNIFLRAVALKAVLSGNLEPKLEALMPKELLENKNNYQNDQDVKEFKQVIGGLLPWHIVRTRLLIGDPQGVVDIIKKANQQSTSARSEPWRQHDRTPFEITRLRFEILALTKACSLSDLENFSKSISASANEFWLSDRLSAVRTAYRLEHLSSIRDQLEKSCRDIIAGAKDDGPEMRAGWYIDLARAVLPGGRADAAAYFDLAIDSVSKFGDEIVQRWDAVVAAAKRSAEGGRRSPEIAYRFIRCAELTGDNVAREKHWDRDEAFIVCARLNPASALAALSRWRDRDVGWFERQLPVLAREFVSSKVVSASECWALSAFEGCYEDEKFALCCIENETDAPRRQYIFNSALRDFRLADSSESTWHKLECVAQKFSLEHTELKEILNFYSEHPQTSANQGADQIPPVNFRRKSEDPNWEKIFDGLDLTNSTGLGDAIARFDVLPAPRYPETFWQEVFKTIPESEASSLLQAIAITEKADLYDVERALSHFPKNWCQKVSVERVWPQVLSSIARRFASELTNHLRLEYFLNHIPAGNNELPSIKKGILGGLAESSHLLGAGALFGFVQIVSSLVSPEEATEVLDFALSRFEIHIDDNFADGPWADWLKPPEDITEAFTGFIWAALGSPISAIRWQSAHCVRRLVESSCEHDVGALINWMSRDYAIAFGSHKFPFYNLHARLYLLIALARAAIDHPEMLKRHYLVFAQHALESIPHILIQKFAAEIAMSIEAAFPGTYDRIVIEQLHRVGISQMLTKELDRSGEELQSPWHARGEVDKSLKLYFAYDFDRYWFDPLGNIFGIANKQVQELGRQVVLKDWNIKIDDEFIRDPRTELWRSHRHERETLYSHTSYPRTHDYSFYLSYHATLAVAAKLVQEMPTVHTRDGYRERWSDWRARHSLTRSDGRWLADRRDPAPLLRRAWLRDGKSVNWRWEIMPPDFLDALLIERDGEAWLNIYGTWTDSDTEREETFYIRSALVPPKTSQSLMNALIACPDPRDDKLPYSQEDEAETEISDFALRSWIWSESLDKGLDEFDPHAADIDYPPYRVDKSIVERFGLSADVEQRKWHLPDSAKPSLVCELWKTPHTEEREEPRRHGMRMSASLGFLETLASVTDRELIIEVQINRRIRRPHYVRSDDDDVKYSAPYSKLYLLSATGRLRDEKTNYQLR